MGRTPEENRVEPLAEIEAERAQMRDAIARGELEATLTSIRDTRNGDEAKLRQMRFGFVLDSVALGGNQPRTYFFSGRAPSRERRQMREIMADPVHAGIALALDAINAYRYDPGMRGNRTAPDNFSQINRPLQND